MEGKVGVVTGGAAGIGRTVARRFAEEGAKVVVADLDAAGGEEAVQTIKDAGGEALFLRTDVSKGPDVKLMVQQTVETFGRLDWAVNNAGIDGPFMPLADYPEDDWDRVIAVNLRGVFLSMKYEIPRMIGGGGGAIVNVASVLGIAGLPNQPAYVAAKHGVVGITRAAALEYASSAMRVNTLCPGAVRTPMVDRLFSDLPDMEEKITALHPIGRIGTPEEVADAALYLCSDQASFITGAVLPLDGGWTAG